jgi:hypothetical protein
LIARFLQRFPIEPGRNTSGAVADTLQGSLSFLLIDLRNVGHQASYRLTMPRDHDLLATLNSIQQIAESIFRLKSAYFHPDII